jgi:hypothetical protein
MAGYRKAHAQKARERTKRWQEKNLLMSRYGIDKDQWNKMFQEQQGKCLICEKHASETKRGLAVDHCHKTGKVRGLLCHTCNKGLGLFRDNAEIISSAIDYLNKHKED